MAVTTVSDRNGSNNNHSESSSTEKTSSVNMNMLIVPKSQTGEASPQGGSLGDIPKDL
jgi:hypothetical protein